MVASIQQYDSPAVRIRVRFADTDAMGVVYHANYLAYFESGRVEAFRRVGRSYDEHIAAGYHLPVVEVGARYRQAARFDDMLLVYAWVEDIGQARFTFGYEIRREADGALLVTGRTVHACVEGTTMRPVRLSPELREAVGQLRRGEE